jgi:hypothetical protein
MSVYLLLKFLHVLLAITAVGANITYGVWLAGGPDSPAYRSAAARTADGDLPGPPRAAHRLPHGDETGALALTRRRPAVAGAS